MVNLLSLPRGLALVHTIRPAETNKKAEEGPQNH